MLGVTAWDSKVRGPKGDSAAPSDDFHTFTLGQMALLGQLWKGQCGFSSGILSLGSHPALCPCAPHDFWAFAGLIILL